MAKTFLDEVKEVYAVANADKEKCKKYAQQQLVEFVKEEILKSAKNGSGKLVFFVDNKQIRHLDFLYNWLSENGMDILSNRPCVSGTTLHISGWTK
jgi:hypothetical protein